MKVFAHGCLINFDRSAREMTPSDLDRLLQGFIGEHSRTWLGTIDLDKSELRLYGDLQSVRIDEGENRCEFVFLPAEGEREERRIVHPADHLAISHEAVFDIEDPRRDRVTVRVVYITVSEPGALEETTYFLADPDACSDILSCVAEFWSLVHEVGRDVDFRVTGCMANDLSFLRKNRCHE
ncbi:hypothetical protein [Staphylospora marina]|uniref:hypothetical protein n=1 Tax=Staphylospora marina TaxID=2490858 RepID=UPI000F5C199C|nr:hypothetical protein [Staphylospora marina]